MTTTNIAKELFKYNGKNNVSEYHVMLHVSSKAELTFDEQLTALTSAYSDMTENELNGAYPVFVRYFISDAANQQHKIKNVAEKLHDCAVSIIEQPPLDGSKIAIWVYAIEGIVPKHIGTNTFIYEHGKYRHIWSGSMTAEGKDSHVQTNRLFTKYIDELKKEKCTLLDNCIRTWFFVQDIDRNYHGVVEGRNEIFAANGLTSKTHSISSTGIGGRNADIKASVQMDAYSINGIKKEQIVFLYAPTHLNPTYEYGVSFERGTYINYGDRRHVIISGTASINNKGEVVHKGDIKKQTERMWENVEALLQEADCNFTDVGQMIVYLRDIADYNIVKKMYDKRFPDTPKVFLLAPVCRPEWLIEMECIAVKTINSEYDKF